LGLKAAKTPEKENFGGFIFPDLGRKDVFLADSAARYFGYSFERRTFFRRPLFQEAIMLKKILVTMGMVLVAGGLQAQTMVPKLDQDGRRGDVARQAKQQAMEKFDLADENKDGKLSREELEKHAPYLAEKLTERDKDRDGFLNWEEYVGHNRWPR
jgi:hypothetical protein